MNIREMNTEIKFATQNISSNRTRRLLDGEIDWLLNKCQHRFIASKVKSRKDGGGFQMDEADADAIRTLVVTSQQPAWIDGDDYVCPLPPQYSFLISADAEAVPVCGAKPVPVVSTQSILQLPRAPSTKETGPFYTDCTLTAGDTSVSLATITRLALPAYTGLASNLEGYLLRDTYLWYLNAIGGIAAYWEDYPGAHGREQFLLPGQSAGEISIDGTGSSGATVTVQRSSYEASGSWTPIRVSRTAAASSLQTTPFWKSSLQSPLAVLEPLNLRVYGDTSFIVSGVAISYVRKPCRMSLPLGLSCELPEESHQAVCDLVVEYFKAMTADPNWEVKLKDNMLRSPML